MKKVVLTFIIILVATYIVLSILGSGDEYAAERLFYRAMRMHEKIAVNPEIALPNMLAAVENNLKKILEKYPKSKVAKATRLALADFYVSHKKYDKALSTLDEIISHEDEDTSVLSKAHFYKGTVYERQDMWEEALQEYLILRDRFTETTLGLQIPIYIGRYYTSKGKLTEAGKAYDEAAQFYEKLEKDKRPTALGYAAANLLRETYLQLGKLEEAGRVVEDIINNYPAELTYLQQLPYVEVIFVRALNRPEKAIAIYSIVKEKTKDKKLTKVLGEVIKKIEESRLSGSRD